MQKNSTRILIAVSTQITGAERIAKKDAKTISGDTPISNDRLSSIGVNTNITLLRYMRRQLGRLIRPRFGPVTIRDRSFLPELPATSWARVTLELSRTSEMAFCIGRTW